MKADRGTELLIAGKLNDLKRRQLSRSGRLIQKKSAWRNEYWDRNLYTNALAPWYKKGAMERGGA